MEPHVQSPTIWQTQAVHISGLDFVFWAGDVNALKFLLDSLCQVAPRPGVVGGCTGEGAAPTESHERFPHRAVLPRPLRAPGGLELPSSGQRGCYSPPPGPLHPSPPHASGPGRSLSSQLLLLARPSLPTANNVGFVFHLSLVNRFFTVL